MTLSPEVACFLYHEVTDDPASSGFQRAAALPFKHSRRAFAQHLDAIATSPCTPALVTDIDLHRPGRHLLLTFDDGGKSALHAGEELSRRGWRGHFFIVTSLIGSRTFLSTGEIRQLRDGGHLIGSHSHTHPNIFSALSPARMLEEWRVSAATLAALLDEPCLAASVPGGDISRTVLQTAAAADLRYLFTSEPWLRPRAVGGCWVFGRFGAKVDTTLPRVQQLAQFQGWGGALLQRRLKVLLRRVAPQAYTWYVERTTRERHPAHSVAGADVNGS